MLIPVIRIFFHPLAENVAPYNDIENVSDPYTQCCARFGLFYGLFGIVHPRDAIIKGCMAFDDIVSRFPFPVYVYTPFFHRFIEGADYIEQETLYFIIPWRRKMNRRVQHPAAAAAVC